MNTAKLLLFVFVFTTLAFASNDTAKSGGESGGLITSVPRTMTYQGILKDSAGDPVADSIYDVTFRIYEFETGGTDEWSSTIPCTTSSGLFNASLAAVNIPFDVDYWLELEVDSEVLDPRQKLSMSAYAARADTADYAQRVATIDGATGGTISGDISATGKATIGSGHTNSGTLATISGGQGNSASGVNATIGGGWGNNVSGIRSTVSGGQGNSASGDRSTVGGGRDNIASGYHASVVGGRDNNASGYISTIGGGYLDTVFAPYGGISAGRNNIAGDTAGDTAAFVGGGWENSAIEKFATVGGGKTNTASGSNSTVSGGVNNTASGNQSTVGGGAANDAGEQYSAISGGLGNTSAGAYSVIGGGYQNDALLPYTTVSGGYRNTASANLSSVAGGSNNTASGLMSIVGGGRDNIASGFGATIPGGDSNSAAGDYSFAAGKHAEANHSSAFVWSDGTPGNFTSTGNRQFLIRAGGGVGIGTNSPTAALDVQGTIKSRSGGYEFPDATVQATAAVSTPIGGIVAWLKSFPNTPALPPEYRECNGALISDPESPYNGQNTPALNSPSKFLISSNASGATGGSTSHSHTVTMGGNVVTSFPPTDLVVPAGTYPTSSALNLPPYYTVVWVMRIK